MMAAVLTLCGCLLAIVSFNFVVDALSDERIPVTVAAAPASFVTATQAEAATAVPARTQALTFSDAGFTMTGVRGGVRPSLSWADVDGDNDLDLLVLGSTDGNATGASATLYVNQGGALTATATSLPPMINCGAAWGDFDRDSDHA